MLLLDISWKIPGTVRPTGEAAEASRPPPAMTPCSPEPRPLHHASWRFSHQWGRLSRMQHAQCNEEGTKRQGRHCLDSCLGTRRVCPRSHCHLSTLVPRGQSPRRPDPSSSHQWASLATCATDNSHSAQPNPSFPSDPACLSFSLSLPLHLCLSVSLSLSLSTLHLRGSSTI